MGGGGGGGSKDTVKTREEGVRTRERWLQMCRS